MSRKILLTPAYQQHREEVEQIISKFVDCGDIVHEGRNSIKTFHTQLGDWNVKRYHKPFLLNRFIYSFLRETKGERAFHYPERVLAANCETPSPIAYVEERNAWGLIGFSYFISEHCPYKRRFYEFGDAAVADCADILVAFASFTARMHESGIYHRDYSPGNILFDFINNSWHFSIVDINRMQFGPVSIKKGCQNFARLWGQPEFFHFLAQAYAQARHADEEQCVQWVMEARNRFWKPRAKHFDLPYQLNF